jgi:sorting nexin-9/18/33
MAAPEVALSGFLQKGAAHQRDASSSTITPRGSIVSQEIVPQNTGEWRTAFPSFRQSLLGGKSLNRFSTFVTSGAEEWVLKGTAADAVISSDAIAGRHERAGSSDSDSEEAEEERNRLNRLGLGEADHHFVDAGLAWKTKLPPFRVLVHSPSKRTSTLSGAFTIYSVTSLFHPPAPDGNSPPPSPTRITVHRRFSHFVILHTALTRRLPGIALPPLPEKQYAGRFSEDFVEARRGDLERYIGRVVRHPVARYAEVVTFFLGCESDTVRVPPAFLVANNAEMGVGVEAAGPATPGDARGGALLLRACVPPGL